MSFQFSVPTHFMGKYARITRVQRFFSSASSAQHSLRPSKGKTLEISERGSKKRNSGSPHKEPSPKRLKSPHKLTISEPLGSQPSTTESSGSSGTDDIAKSLGSSKSHGSSHTPVAKTSLVLSGHDQGIRERQSAFSKPVLIDILQPLVPKIVGPLVLQRAKWAPQPIFASKHTICFVFQRPT